MCGIAGIIAPSQDVDVLTENLGQMLTAIHHRGPDSGGVYVREGIALGMRRLSIIDLEHGQQPKVSEEENHVLVFNGEIYNYRELRAELQAKGYRFSTESDSEVLLKSYQYWGRSVVEHLDGMFAFAVYDRREQLVFIARDHFGIKPLYYFAAPSFFAFASEPNALLGLKEIPRKLSLVGLSHYLTLKYIPAPHSFIEQMSKLPAAHCMTIDLSGKKTDEVKRYWQLQSDIVPLPESEALEQMQKKFQQAVERQFVSDVPVGLFLSGGVDSGLLAWASSVLKGHSLEKAFTASFSEAAAFDESKVAQETAAYFKIPHELASLKEPSLEDFSQCIEQYGEPFANLSIPANFLIHQAAAQKLKVAFNGSGSDELFGGYDRYYAVMPPRALRIASTVSPILRLLFAALPASSAPGGLVKRARRYLYSASLSPAERHVLSIQLFLPEEMSALAPELPSVTSKMVERFESIDAPSLLHQAALFDVETMLSDDYLTLVDRTSMAHSMEVRVPFLDLHFSQFAHSLESRYKIVNWQKKVLPRLLGERVLPRDIAQRPKRGFESPVGEWMRGQLGDTLLELYHESELRPLFNQRFIETLLQAHRNQQTDGSKQLLSLYTLFYWAKHWTITL